MPLLPPAAVGLGLFGLILSIAVPTVLGNGANRNGVGARSMAMGGASVADVNDTFAATNADPAFLGSPPLADDLALGLVGVVADGSFENGAVGKGLLDDRSGAFPEFAVRKLLGQRVGLGFSVVPEQTRVADWVFAEKTCGIDGTTS